MSRIRIAHNAIVAKLVEEDANACNIISELLTYPVDGAEHMGRFQNSSWDGQSTFFSYRKRTFPAGFVHIAQAKLQEHGYTVGIVRPDLDDPAGPESPIVDEFGNDDPRYEFQLRALRQVEKHRAGIIQIATGGGKSKVAKLIMARFRRPTLFLTTRGVLMHQMSDHLRSSKFKVGIIGDGVYEPIRGFNCGMVQTFVSRLDETSESAFRRQCYAEHVKLQERNRKAGKEVPPDLTNQELADEARKRFERSEKIRRETIDFLQTVEVVVGEEAHEAGGDSYYEILRHCKKANIRIGLTATPFMRDNVASNMRLMAAFGPVLIKVSEQKLIDSGILATPYFKIQKVEPHPKLRKSSPWQRAVTLGYLENENLMNQIVADARNAKLKKAPVLTLVQRTDHGKAILKAFKENKIVAVYLRGEDDQETRLDALRKLSKGAIDAIIGTTILDVGVDVPSIGLVQLAGGGKAEVALRQRIGRGLRAKKSGPNITFVADYAVEGNLYLRRHNNQRKSIIENTPGFAERILKPGQDFPWNLYDEN